MSDKYIPYKGILLAKGSFARQLYDAKDFKALDVHLKSLDRAEENLRNKYDKKTPVEKA